MKRLQFILLLLFTMAGTPFAQPFHYTSFSTFDSITYEDIIIMYDSVRVPGNNLIQVIKVGPNGVPDPANPFTGAVGGDDSLMYTRSVSSYGGGFSFSVNGYGITPPLPVVYLRVWTGFGRTIVTSVPVPPNSSYSQTRTYTLSDYYGEYYGVQVLPNSSTPTWTRVNEAPIVPVFSVGYQNGATINFGRHFVGEDTTINFLIRNIGYANLVLSSPVTNQPFSISLNRYSIAPQDSANCQLTFTPTSAGTASETAYLPFNAIGSPFRLELTGFGISHVTANLIYFVAVPGNRQVMLSWRTESEYQSNLFTILRCLGDTGTFVRIASIPTFGTSTSSHSYTFLDTPLLNDSTYRYQLAVTDRQGSEHLLSPIVSATPTSTGIVNHAPLIITKYALSSHPNPFNPTTRITFDLKEAGNVSLFVYDIMGKRVATLASGRFNAGRFTTEFNAENLPAGIYFARLSVNKYSEIRKLVLVK